MADTVKENVSNKDLVQTTYCIDGEWGDAGGETYEVVNPATSEVIAELTKCSTAETEKAIDAAAEAFASWRKETAATRAGYLLAWKSQIEENVDDIAAIMTMECGKPLAEAKLEISAGLMSLEWMAAEAQRAYGKMLQSTAPDRQMLTLMQPVGVVGAITPWNFPFAMITRKCAPALAAGCTVVVKPSEQTPLTAMALMHLAQKAGIPKGVLNMVSGEAKDIGNALMDSSTVRKFGFTGSTKAGKFLMGRCAETVKRVSMELGGNAPFIVFEDADLEAAAKAAVGIGLFNAGQVCIAGNRMLVHESVHDKFADLMLAEIKSLKVGDGLKEGTTMGPCINADQAEWAQTNVDDAVEKGGNILTGGKKPELGGALDKGYFFAPTLVGNASKDMKLYTDETFSPVVPLFTFKTDEEALAMANDTLYGLAAYFFSKDLKRCWHVAAELEYGMIGCNETSIEEAPAPFGGIKQSGLGRENGPSGIYEFLEEKYVCMGLNG